MFEWNKQARENNLDRVYGRDKEMKIIHFWLANQEAQDISKILPRGLLQGPWWGVGIRIKSHLETMNWKKDGRRIYDISGKGHKTTISDSDSIGRKKWWDKFVLFGDG